MGRNHRFSYPPFFYFSPYPYGPCADTRQNTSCALGYSPCFFESSKHFLFVSFFCTFIIANIFCLSRGFWKKVLIFLKIFFGTGFLPIFYGYAINGALQIKKNVTLGDVFSINLLFFWQNVVKARGHGAIHRPQARLQTAVLRSPVGACPNLRRYIAVRGEFS